MATEQLKTSETELTKEELIRILGCGEDEFDDFVEMDLSYQSSDLLTTKYRSMGDIGLLKSLERLTLGEHSLKDISPVKNLKHLKYLNLSRNNISDIRPITNLYLLEELVLDYNNISSFPRDLYKLRNLKILSLAHNKVTYESFQDLLALTALQSLTLVYNPVLMRDKENRRDLVYFLYNRLHHFELFNGIHINTLFTRVSCGKDYLEDIIDSDNASPSFVAYPHHVRTIGDKKNLAGNPRWRNRSKSPIRNVVLSPFSLDEYSPDDLEPPVTPPFAKRASEKKDTENQPPPFLLSSPTKPVSDRRFRSMSMFESLCNPPENPVPIPEKGEEISEKEGERREARCRKYSVHDAILQDGPKAKSMFTNTEIGNQAHKDGVMMPPMRKEEGNGVRKPLFSKPPRKEGSGMTRLMKEIEKMNSTLELILNNQKTMQNTLDRLQRQVNVCMEALSLEQNM